MNEPALRYCSRGNEVVRLQLMLREIDFTLEPDGIFGPMTQEAVKTFQALHALPGTGAVTPQTWDILENCYLLRILPRCIEKTPNDHHSELSAGNRT